jgi:hypothetical protein
MVDETCSAPPLISRRASPFAPATIADPLSPSPDAQATG